MILFNEWELRMNTGDINSTNVGDFDPSKIKVVVGLSNKLDSFVTAYLLKKQKFNLIGITIQTWNVKKKDDDEEQDLDEELFSDDQATKEIVFSPPTCSIIDTTQIEKFCKWLDIPYYITDASNDFEREIVEKAVDRRIEGRFFQSCLRCHSFRVNTLFSKAQKLGAHLIATGHYAKIHLNKNFNQHFIYKANDLVNDQSFILANLGENILEKILLPLGNISKDEVYKLAKANLKSILSEDYFKEIKSPSKKPNEFNHCLVNDPNMAAYVEQNTTHEFWSPIVLVRKESDLTEGDFPGRYCVNYGSLKSQYTSDRISDKNRILEFKEERAYFGLKSHFETKYFEVYNLKVLSNVSRLKPLRCFIKKDAYDLMPATMYFKSSDRALFEVENNACFHPDEKMAIYDSDSKMGKVIGYGHIVSRVEELYTDKLADFREEKLDLNDKEIYEGF